MTIVIAEKSLIYTKERFIMKTERKISRLFTLLALTLMAFNIFALRSYASEEPHNVENPASTDNETIDESDVETSTYYCIATKSLNIRSGPGTEYKVLGSFSSGEEIEVIMIVETDNDWAEIFYNENYAYVSSKYISLNKEDIPDPEDSSSSWDGPVLTKRAGKIQGPSGEETYYNLKMSGVVKIMRKQGFSEEEYPYWVRDDGVKMLGPYIMCAANLKIYPRGSLVESSLGMAIVCDTGEFAKKHPYRFDIAVNW